MPEVKIDELHVASISQLPPEVSVDELHVTAISEYPPAFNIDRLYSRAIYPTPASITVDGIHAGAIRPISLPSRFKEGYKKEVLDTLANSLGIALSVDNYDIEIKGLDEANPRNTKLRLLARKVSTYRRYSDVIYQRAEAERLGSLIVYDQLKATEAWPLDTTARIVDRINTLFGTTLTELDFVEEATPVGQDRYLTAKPESFYFHPGTKINLGRLDINERSGEIAGLTWSDVLGGATAYNRLPYKIHSTDFTSEAGTLAGITTSGMSATDATNLIAAMTRVVSHGFNASPYNTTVGGVRGLTTQTLTLPAETDIPVDNSGYYNRALVINFPNATWAPFRYLILHYNV